MTIFNHVLVAVDFAESSDDALEVAVGLALKLDAALTLVHVCEIPIFDRDAGPLSVEQFAFLEDAARKRLDLALASVQTRVAGADAILRRGAPAAEILAVIEVVRPDVVVLGTHGRQGLPRTLLGSVAEKIVRTAPVPVLTVRGRAERR